VKNLLLPAENKKDLVDVPKVALKDLNITFVENMQQVMDIMLLEPPVKRQRDLDIEAEEDAAEEKEPAKKPRTRRRRTPQETGINPPLNP
jgi:hypothetical protein